MSNDCGCDGRKAAVAATGPTLEPANIQSSNGGTSMSDQRPVLTPPAAGFNDQGQGSQDAAPTFTPATMAAATGGITAWNSNKRVSALWGINQNRNSWVHVPGVGWKKLANNLDSAVMAHTILAANAKQAQGDYNYRDEADGMIHEAYVW